jgi:F-type H+-transporting ATPase subunit delta
MQIGGAAKRYAQAIFALARETTTVREWQRDLATLSQLVTDPEGQAFFGSPTIDRHQKWQAAERLLTGRVQPAALNLARLLIDRDRFAEVERVETAFTDFVHDLEGTAVAEVTTAVPLDEAATADLRRRLGALVNKQVEMRTRVDPSIIGGVIARVGDYLIDGSVTGQLRRLRARLVEAR